MRSISLILTFSPCPVDLGALFSLAVAFPWHFVFIVTMLSLFNSFNSFKLNRLISKILAENLIELVYWTVELYLLLFCYTKRVFWKQVGSPPPDPKVRSGEFALSFCIYMYYHRYAIHMKVHVNWILKQAYKNVAVECISIRSFPINPWGVH